jgi:hypothetical protein
MRTYVILVTANVTPSDGGTREYHSGSTSDDPRKARKALKGLLAARRKMRGSALL